MTDHHRLMTCTVVQYVINPDRGVLKPVQLGQSFKTVGYGCTSCWGDVGAEDAEADVFYISFIVSVQHIEY